MVQGSPQITQASFCSSSAQDSWHSRDTFLPLEIASTFENLSPKLMNFPQRLQSVGSPCQWCERGSVSVTSTSLVP